MQALAVRLNARETGMPKNEREDGRETEDDRVRRELGPRGVPGEPDRSKLTKNEKEQMPKPLDPGHTA